MALRTIVGDALRENDKKFALPSGGESTPANAGMLSITRVLGVREMVFRGPRAEAATKGDVR